MFVSPGSTNDTTKLQPMIWDGSLAALLAHTNFDEEYQKEPLSKISSFIAIN